MALSDLYNLVTEFHLGTTQITKAFCSWWYVQDTGSVGVWSDLAAQFNTYMTPLIIAAQSNDWTLNRIIVHNMTNLADFGESEITSGNQGLVASQTLPSFCCWSFIIKRTSRANRHGWKRIPGPPESLSDGGVATSGAVSGVLADLAAGIESSLVHPVGFFGPRIVSRTKVGGVWTYTPHAIAGCDYRHIGSQTSRKVGRGV